MANLYIRYPADIASGSVTVVQPNGALLHVTVDNTLIPEAYDYQAITYVGSTTDVSTVVYKAGGPSGTTVATLTLTYDGSNRLTAVTRS